MSADSAGATLAGAAPIFAALGDPTRLRIVARLSTDGPLSITSLARGEPVSRQAISKHLESLSDAGLVRGERHGREHRWQLEPTRLDDARLYLEAISHQWDNALTRLQRFVEDA